MGLTPNHDDRRAFALTIRLLLLLLVLVALLTLARTFLLAAATIADNELPVAREPAPGIAPGWTWPATVIHAAASPRRIEPPQTTAPLGPAADPAGPTAGQDLAR